MSKEALMLENELQELITAQHTTLLGPQVTASHREMIERTVTKVARYGIKRPAKSKELAGEWEVLYTSRPDAHGSPVSGPSGIVRCSDLPMEEIHEVGTFRSNVAFKSLGIFDNSIQKRGEVRAVSADKYQLAINELHTKTWLGSASVKQIEDTYDVQVVYLGDVIRVIKISSKDDEEPCLVILRKRGKAHAQVARGITVDSLHPEIPSRSGVTTMASPYEHQAKLAIDGGVREKGSAIIAKESLQTQSIKQNKASTRASVATAEPVKTAIKPRKALSAKDLGTLHLKGIYRFDL
ncbi:hypothetical protein CEUSTIGMA_g3129.t1 [Chlamydomonas eustigma]|uniref:Plastid lipid-associated protein/fibrillin conserved domain-containing protein n=1 Tax=Chlamydomonas eustigma TaxID=1157962 RepID=A0A250WY27_9CHLO|nr:hypothetical protein CEUSTIGMA_g3129.t1 [Chlamydomonas eustigma]|eukprot:GAX75686.1 hypothetical protein CEUSTIGMA_g3129.t1 [Chlamydomonas eustigma]